jgi:hypothetical protein
MFELMLLFVQLSGFCILVGAFVLLFKRIVILDAETRQPTSFKFPLLGEVRTQTPVLAIILVGAALVFFPVTMSGPMEVPSKPLKGVITGKLEQARVLIVGHPDFIALADEEGRFSTYIPLVKKKMTYQLLVLDGKQQIVTATIDDSTDWQHINISAQRMAPAAALPTPTNKEFVINPTLN